MSLAIFAAVAAPPTSVAASPVDDQLDPVSPPRHDVPGARTLDAGVSAPPSQPTSPDPVTPPTPSGRNDDTGTKRSRVLSAAGTAAIYGALYGWLSLAWFVRTTDSDQFQFHDEGWFGSDTYAGGADKLGHAWGNYAMTRGVSQILAYGGWNRRASILVASGLSLAFFTFSEIKDGYKLEYGSSYGDMIANTTGAALGVAFELLPELDRRFDFHISYLPSSDYLARLGEDGPFNTPEDYSGQVSLISYHLGSSELVRRRASWAEFVDLDIGFQALNYKPVPSDGGDRSQQLFVGLSLNLQAVFDAVISRHAGAGVVHFITEVYQAPFTTLRLLGLERTRSALRPETP